MRRPPPRRRHRPPRPGRSPPLPRWQGTSRGGSAASRYRRSPPSQVPSTSRTSRGWPHRSEPPEPAKGAASSTTLPIPRSKAPAGRPIRKRRPASARPRCGCPARRKPTHAPPSRREAAKAAKMKGVLPSRLPLREGALRCTDPRRHALPRSPPHEGDPNPGCAGAPAPLPPSTAAAARWRRLRTLRTPQGRPSSPSRHRPCCDRPLQNDQDASSTDGSPSCRRQRLRSRRINDRDTRAPRHATWASEPGWQKRRPLSEAGPASMESP